MAVVLTNNATSLLAGAITAGATTLSIDNADAGKFPTPTPGDWFPLTIVDSAGNMEIVRATARAGAIITVERAQEGTIAKAFAAGTRIDVRLTAGALGEIGDKATTATVGAAVAGANGGDNIADGDTLTGVLSGTSTLRRWTWGNIKSWIKAAITKGDVGLGNVNNTSDADKPISTATQGALNGKISGDGANFAGFANNNAGIPYMRHQSSNTVVGLARQADLDAANTRISARVEDTRIIGLISTAMNTTGGASATSGESGYVVTSISKRSGVEVIDIYSRQPQRSIPSQGWRPMGIW
ncbi:hypothetical protein M8994_17240 [Brucella sp. 21LCYQ03]|nr:hypothetical protein [Brucella sp. 21LCYQ03]